MNSTPAHDGQNPDSRIQKRRRPEVWALSAAVLILLGLLGYVLNQQQASTRPPDGALESQPRPSSPAPSAAETKTPAVPKSSTPRQSAENNADKRTPSQVAYVVTHKHRLRDCHGTMTLTRAALRFESDEPQDSFAVGVDDVTVEGDALRIRDKTWRFEFPDGVRAERIFQDWQTGALFKR